MPPEVSREEFDELKKTVESLSKRIVELHPTVEEHDDRLDEHDRQLDEVKRELRAIVSAVGRLADVVTPLSMGLPRMERNIARVLEIIEPRKVIVGEHD